MVLVPACTETAAVVGVSTKLEAETVTETVADLLKLPLLAVRVRVNLAAAMVSGVTT